MTKLRALGVRIALDDFGVGYSSLSYLKSLPLDAMKIDTSLVQGLGESERDRHVMTSVLQLAKATNLFVIAEGVETAEQVSILRSLGCETLQGYYFSRPLFKQAFFAYVRARTPA
jgi:EAL domain-containing protein (putative c-di-GMP-specific phosphodiesterase class I)